MGRPLGILLRLGREGACADAASARFGGRGNRSFQPHYAVFAMPKGTYEEKSARAAALEEATLYAAQVPLKTMKAAMEVFDVAHVMAVDGNPNSLSDAGVAILAARAAVRGAALNVMINAAGLKDTDKAKALKGEAQALAAEADSREQTLISEIEERL